jgi:hypothetical protein
MAMMTKKVNWDAEPITVNGWTRPPERHADDGGTINFHGPRPESDGWRCDECGQRFELTEQPQPKLPPLTFEF